MQYEISGTVMQTLSISLSPGESVFAQTHGMAWMTETIEMDTHTGGGMFAGLKRALGGGSFFITDYKAGGGAAEVAFAPRFPGKILAMKLGAGQSLVCRKETFLCAERGVTLDIVLQQKLGAGFFAGEGFILQKVTGPGTVFLDLSGEVIERTLASGERLRVHAGHIGMQEPSVATDIAMVGGLRNMIFGGEGLFLATLTGPGKIWLQSMPVINLAEEIARYLPSEKVADAGAGAGLGRLAGGGLGGAALGGIIGGILGSE